MMPSTTERQFEYTTTVIILDYAGILALTLASVHITHSCGLPPDSNSTHDLSQSATLERVPERFAH
jgi:hypothetical protein